MAEEFKYVVRVAGIDLDGSLKVSYALSKVKGLGKSLGRAVARVAGVNPDSRIGYLTDDEVRRLEEAVREPSKLGLQSWLLNRRKDLESGADLHLTGPTLELRTKMDVELMKQIRSWKGIRHSLGLKVRGQRTRTTGRTGRAVGVRKKTLLAAAQAAAQAQRGERRRE
ncbi:MAG: 30S ribosomal protein S13 [Candidatus Bathyarchaeia archaeon]